MRQTLCMIYKGFWDLEIFWMATHFVAVFLVGNNTLTTDNNIFWDLEKFRDFWDLEKFRRATHFVAVFFVENNALTR